MARPAIQKSVVGAVAVPEIGRASGAGSTIRWLGAVLGIAILTAVFAGRGSLASPRAFTAGLVPALAVAAALALAGTFIGLAMPGRRGAPATAAYPSMPEPQGAARRER